MPINPKLAVPVVLGLSLVSVTAFVFYYVFKKEEEESTEINTTSRRNVIEISIPKSIVPALIGRQGSNIKNIENKSGAKLNVRKHQDQDHDVCVIQGSMEATKIAETIVHDFIKNQPVIIEDILQVPNWACSRIIGSGGDNITSISHRSGARIKVDGNQADGGTIRHIRIKGTKEQIDVAKGIIDGVVAQEKCRREIEHSKRASRHSQPGSPTNSSVSDSSHSSSFAQNSTAAEMSEMPGEKKHASLRKSEVSGAAIEVYVSAVSSPSRFWVQFVGPQVARLDELVDHMTEYYGDRAHREALALSTVSVGQVVAAVFRHDGRWYRARVQDVRPNEFDPTQQVADVFYVDYGDSEYVAVRELCELRADLLRLRFQAMECFLVGVRPADSEDQTAAGGIRWEKWPSNAVERFEELTQVARWKALVSKICSYKKTPVIEGGKEREIPGIKLYDVTEEGEIDIGAILISEGLAKAALPSTSPRASPARATPPTPFGDLGNSRILNMLGDLGERGERASSLPKHDTNGNVHKDDLMPTSQSLGSGLETHQTPPHLTRTQQLSEPQQPHQSEPHEPHQSSLDLIHAESHHNVETNGSQSPIKAKIINDELKANMNRIDSHHGNLEALGRHD